MIQGWVHAGVWSVVRYLAAGARCYEMCPAPEPGSYCWLHSAGLASARLLLAEAGTDAGTTLVRRCRVRTGHRDLLLRDTDFFNCDIDIINTICPLAPSSCRSAYHNSAFTIQESIKTLL